MLVQLRILSLPPNTRLFCRGGRSGRGGRGRRALVQTNPPRCRSAIRRSVLASGPCTRHESKRLNKQDIVPTKLTLLVPVTAKRLTQITSYRTIFIKLSGRCELVPTHRVDEGDDADVVALLPHGFDLVLAELVDGASALDEASVLRLVLAQVTRGDQAEN